ncbi:MAG: hypothetical protein HY763_03920 [Planctomycetes bacterium]|nr:hypothetical protein [Planctomycetota bacterium]
MGESAGCSSEHSQKLPGAVRAAFRAAASGVGPAALVWFAGCTFAGTWRAVNVETTSRADLPAVLTLDDHGRCTATHERNNERHTRTGTYRVARGRVIFTLPGDVVYQAYRRMDGRLTLVDPAGRPSARAVYARVPD